MRFVFSLVAALALSALARAEVDGAAFKTAVPVVAVVGASPPLDVSYSVGNNAPRFDVVALEVKNAAGTVVYSHFLTIDSNDGGGEIPYGAIALPAGEYIAKFYFDSQSSATAIAFSVLAPVQAPGGFAESGK